MARTLPEAAFAKKLDEVRQLLAAGVAVDTADSFGRTALHCAVMVNHLALVELLLEAGGRLDVPDSVGDVPLHFAAQHRARLPVLRVLLARAPQVVNQVGGAGRTPIAVAADLNFVEGVRLLLEHGADPTIKDLAGLSAIDRAPNAKLAALLRSATPKKPVAGKRTRRES